MALSIYNTRVVFQKSERNSINAKVNYHYTKATVMHILGN